MMTLQQLKNDIDKLIRTHNGDKEVRITLSEPSAGARASCGIAGIFSGIDWEYAQIRIEPDKSICSRGKEKSHPKEILIWKYTSPRQFYTCPDCDQIIKKDHNFCPYCGQSVIFNKNAEPADSYKAKENNNA